MVLTQQLCLNHGLIPGIQQCVCAGFSLYNSHSCTAPSFCHITSLSEVSQSSLAVPMWRCEVGFSPLLKCPLWKGSPFSTHPTLHQVFDNRWLEWNNYIISSLLCVLSVFSVVKAALSLLYTGSAVCLFRSSNHRRPWQSERPHWAGLPSEHYRPGEVCTCTNLPQTYIACLHWTYVCSPTPSTHTTTLWTIFIPTVTWLPGYFTVYKVHISVYFPSFIVRTDKVHFQSCVYLLFFLFL